MVERRDQSGNRIDRIAYGKDGKPIPGGEEQFCLSLECRQASSHEGPISPSRPPAEEAPAAEGARPEEPAFDEGSYAKGSPPGAGALPGALPAPGRRLSPPRPPEHGIIRVPEEPALGEALPMAGGAPHAPGEPPAGEHPMAGKGYEPPRVELPPSLEAELKAPPPEFAAARAAGQTEEEAFLAQQQAPLASRDPEEALKSLLEFYKKREIKELMGLVDPDITGVGGYESFERRLSADSQNLDSVHLSYKKPRPVRIHSENTRAELELRWTRTARFSKGETWTQEGSAKATFSNSPSGWRLFAMDGQLPFPASNEEGKIVISTGQGTLRTGKGKPLSLPQIVSRGSLSPSPEKASQ